MALRRGLHLVPRLGRLHAGLLEHVLAVDQGARARVPGLAPDLAVERRGVDEAGHVLARRRLLRPRRTRPGRRTRASRSSPSPRRRAPPPPAIAVVNLSWACAHGTNSMLTVVPGLAAWKSVAYCLTIFCTAGRARVHDPDVDRARQLAALRGRAVRRVVSPASGQRQRSEQDRRGDPSARIFTLYLLGLWFIPLRAKTAAPGGTLSLQLQVVKTTRCQPFTAPPVRAVIRCLRASTNTTATGSV